jgi:hypothetical protein
MCALLVLILSLPLHLTNVLMFSSEFQVLPLNQDLHVELYQGLGLDLASTVATFTALKKTCHNPSKTLPYHVFHAAPPTTQQILLTTVEVLTPSSLAISWSGRTYPMRERFERAGVDLGELESGERVRVLCAEKGN